MLRKLLFFGAALLALLSAALVLLRIARTPEDDVEIWTHSSMEPSGPAYFELRFHPNGYVEAYSDTKEGLSYSPGYYTTDPPGQIRTVHYKIISSQLPEEYLQRLHLTTGEFASQMRSFGIFTHDTSWHRPFRLTLERLVKTAGTSIGIWRSSPRTLPPSPAP